MQKLIVWVVGAFVGLSILSLLTAKIVERNDTTDNLVIQYPTGTVNVHTKPGLKPQWFGKDYRYKKEGDYFFEKDIRFSDKGVATIFGSFRYRLSENESMIREMHKAYPDEKSVKTSLIGNTVDRAIFATGPLMTSEESASERRNDLLFFIEDQAENGVYKTRTESVVKSDPLSGKEVVVTRNIVVKDTVKGGIFRVQQSDIKQYDISLYKLTIDSIKYNDLIDSLLVTQVKAEMSVQNAKAEAIAAEQEAIKAIANGKKEVAIVQASKAKELAEKLGQARNDSIEAAMQLLTATLDAQKRKVEADAEAYEKKKLVVAGLSPEDKEKYRNQRVIGIAEALAKRPVPSIISGGEGKASDATEILIMKMLQQEMK